MPQKSVRHGTLTGYTADRCRCDDCRSAAREAHRRWAKQNPGRSRRRDPERQREYGRRSYWKNREAKLERQRRWYRENRDHVREYDRRRREERGAAMDAARTRWRKVNPERDRATQALRAARKRGLPNEPIDRAVVFERDDGMCGICGLAVDPDDWHLDHVIPISKDGPHLYSNVQVAHPECNRRKNARTGWKSAR